jgi:hypothetical protein
MGRREDEVRLLERWTWDDLETRDGIRLMPVEYQRNFPDQPVIHTHES